MSALTKPLIHSTKVSSGASDPVNVELCSTIASVDNPAIPGRNQADRFSIVFQIADDSNSPIAVEWKYATAVLRDQDLASVLALASTVLV